IVAIRQVHAERDPGPLTDARVYLRYVERIADMTQAELVDLGKAARLLAEAERLDALGRGDDAVDSAQQGLQLRHQALGYSDKEYLDQLGVQAMRLLRNKNIDEAKTLNDQLLAGMPNLFGAENRWYASALNAAALMSARYGDTARALARREQATAIYLKTL